MNELRSGELFAGVGGLGMAVDAVFGTTPAWFCEFDEAPSKVLAYRYPNVPNFGDVTAVDWTQVERPNILAGGFPCQDVSLAGRRRGMKDGTRSGLWSEFAKAIDTLRPEWVVIENVRGLLSAEAHSDLEPCPLCVGDNPGHVLRALGAVLGDLAELGFDAEWTGIRASDVGAPHGRFRVFILAWPQERTLADSGGGRGRGWSIAPGRSEGARADAPAHRADPRVDGAPDELTLLPTPTAMDSKASGGSVPANKTLTDATVRTGEILMPTPRATRGGSSTEMSYAMGGARSDDERPQGVAVPGADWGPYMAAVARWERVLGRPAPSPVRLDGKGGKARLNPELPEWMMGWPAGWVTDPAIGLSRAHQLKAAGNGVVPQQAAAALRELLSRPGVPALEWGLAA